MKEEKKTSERPRHRLGRKKKNNIAIKRNWGGFYAKAFVH
jgi:hypothetical protein